MVRAKPLDRLTLAGLWRARRPPGLPARAVWERTDNFPPALVIRGLTPLPSACYSPGRPAVDKGPIRRPRGRRSGRAPMTPRTAARYPPRGCYRRLSGHTLEKVTQAWTFGR